MPFEFKRALYGAIDERMAGFFPDGAGFRIRLDEIVWGGVVVNGIPVNVDFGTAVLQRIFPTPPGGPGDALLTIATAFPDDPAFIGLPFFMQWFVSDVAAAGELAASRGAAFTAL